MYRQHGPPTKRGWLFLGEQGGPCDKACSFCYYAFQPNLVFHDLETLMMIANRFRHVYYLEACDITGGEPTILKGLVPLVRHCANIGLKPTIITHGQNNKRPLVEQVEDAGLDDWLVSMHGCKDSHDSLVLKHGGKSGDGGYDRLRNNLKNCTRPIRFNLTLTEANMRDLPEWARTLVGDYPATVANMINFNPFHEWSGKERIEFQEKLTVLAPFVAEAVTILEAGGWEANVRYFPFCVAEPFGFAANCVNYYQTQHDPWEWCLAATGRRKKAEIATAGGIVNMRRLIIDNGQRRQRHTACPPCQKCAVRTICEGPTPQYIQRFGTDELAPYEGDKQHDPNWFMFREEEAAEGAVA